MTIKPQRVTGLAGAIGVDNDGNLNIVNENDPPWSPDRIKIIPSPVLPVRKSNPNHDKDGKFSSGGSGGGSSGKVSSWLSTAGAKAALDKAVALAKDPETAKTVLVTAINAAIYSLGKMDQGGIQDQVVDNEVRNLATNLKITAALAKEMMVSGVKALVGVLSKAKKSEDDKDGDTLDRLQELYDALTGSVKKYNPDQTRDDHGRFGSGSAGLGGPKELAQSHTKQDWKKANIELTDKAFGALTDHWKGSPAEFHAAMTGGGLPKSVLRVAYVESFGEMQMIVTSDLKNNSNQIIGGFSERLTFDTGIVDLTLFALEAPAQGANIAKSIMASQVASFQKMGMKEIQLDANIDVGGYAWAKYGCVPLLGGWSNIKGQIRSNLNEMEQSGQIGPNAAEKIDGLIGGTFEKNNPKGIWAVSDLTTPVEGVPLGKRLLLGTSWSGKLDLTDTQSMKRFNAYVGKKN